MVKINIIDTNKLSDDDARYYFDGDKIDFIDCELSEDGKTVNMTMRQYQQLMALKAIKSKIYAYDESKLTPKQRKQLDKIRDDNYHSDCDCAVAEYRYLSSIFDN